MFYTLISSLLQISCLFISRPVNKSPRLSLSYFPSPHSTIPIFSWSELIHFIVLLRFFRNHSTESSSPDLSLITSLPFSLSWVIMHSSYSFLTLSRPKVFPRPSPCFHNNVGAEHQGARALLNMVKHKEEETVWKWVRLWYRQIDRLCFTRWYSVWKYRGVSMTAAGLCARHNYCKDYGCWRWGHNFCFIKWARQDQLWLFIKGN